MTDGAGDSSTIFWFRRCAEQSRSPRWIPRPVRVEEHLDLDVTRALEIALEDEPVVAEGPMRLASGGRQRLGQRARLADDAHALAAASGAGLDQQGIADALRLGGQRRVVLRRAVVARDRRNAVGGRAPASLGLVAHRGDRLGRRPDPAEAGGGHVAGEVRILGEEAVAGVDRVGADARRDREDRLAVEVARDLVCLVGPCRRAVVGRVDADDPHPQPVRGPRDPRRDLPAVRDEQGPDRSADGPPIGAPSATAESDERDTRTLDPTRVAGAGRRRSSAGRSERSRRARRRPAAASAHRACRDCRRGSPESDPRRTKPGQSRTGVRGYRG